MCSVHSAHPDWLTTSLKCCSSHTSFDNNNNEKKKTRSNQQRWWLDAKVRCARVRPRIQRENNKTNWRESEKTHILMHLLIYEQFAHNLSSILIESWHRWWLRCMAVKWKLTMEISLSHGIYRVHCFCSWVVKIPLKMSSDSKEGEGMETISSKWNNWIDKKREWNLQKWMTKYVSFDDVATGHDQRICIVFVISLCRRELNIFSMTMMTKHFVVFENCLTQVRVIPVPLPSSNNSRIGIRTTHMHDVYGVRAIAVCVLLHLNDFMRHFVRWRWFHLVVGGGGGSEGQPQNIYTWGHHVGICKLNFFQNIFLRWRTKSVHSRIRARDDLDSMSIACHKPPPSHKKRWDHFH